MVRVFNNGPENLGSIPDPVILKTFKMVLDTALLNTQQYKVRIKGKVEQFLIHFPLFLLGIIVFRVTNPIFLIIFLLTVIMPTIYLLNST